ncbi:MAG: hypothetical protein ACI8RZ_000755 [Myxococcota bacterium]|jgi:hypothetical protein
MDTDTDTDADEVCDGADTDEDCSLSRRQQRARITSLR